MKLSSLIAAHPIFIFLFLVVAVMVLPSFLITWSFNLAKDVKENVDVNIQRFHSGLVTEIGSTGKLLQTMNSSAANLARIIAPLLNGHELSEFDVDTKVAPLLFQSFSTIPLMSQASYIGLEGPFFSYYYEGNRTFAMYTNVTTSSNSSISDARKNYTWYKQAVDPATGKPYGGVVKSPPFSGANTSWIQQAFNSTSGFASQGSGWNSARDPLFLNSVNINGQGIISLGFSVTELMGFFSGIVSSYNGSFCYFATQNGDVLLGGIPNTRMLVAGESVSFHLVKPAGGAQVHLGNVPCMPSNGLLTPSVLNIGGEQYDFYCSPIEIVGVQSVYALAFPHEEVPSEVHKRSKIAFILSIVMMVLLFIAVSSFITLMVRAARREMQLRSALIRQMETIQQAERKSMNKSDAFVRASHDIRSALGCIIGLVDLSFDPGSNLETNLTDIRKYTKELEGILNSVLDTSKIEAGKMPLEEEEFDIAELVEDAVDLYYPVGIQKSVDVVLDHCDGSVAKFRHVKGDREKLKKVLWNLLSNAVKFTCQGHVSVRVRARKCGLEDKMIAPSNTQTGFWTKFSNLIGKNRANHGEESKSGNPVKQSPNCVEFVFEVDDTGIGIPKDKRESVFENYVQVKEKALQVEGTGLGLGIVQSLVRLMGGEIEIVDKDNDEKGTCFRFNVFLVTLDTPTDSNKGDTETGEDSASESARQYLGLTIRTPTPGLTICNSSPRLTKLGSSPKVEGSHVVLLIANEQRRKVSQKYFERFGIKVTVVDRWDRFHSTLKKIKRKYQVSHSSGKSDLDSWSESSSVKSKELPLSSLEGADQKLPLSRSSTGGRAPAGFTLLVIDASAGPFEDISRDVAGFRRGLPSSCCKVVWLDRPTSRNLGRLDDDVDSSESNLLKPFHGSRLDEVRKLLPEFGGASSLVIADEAKKKSSTQARKGSNDPGTSLTMLSNIRTRSELGARQHERNKGEIESEDSSCSDGCRLVRAKSHKYSATKGKSVDEQPSEIEEVSDHQVLGGMNFLVVDDNPAFRMIAKHIILRHGGTVKLCEDGQVALELVLNGLQEQDGPYVPPCDFILMDYQMPKMDGCEATRLIRKEEKRYGVHIPIIASSAHDMDEIKKMLEAGMDAYVPKQLTITVLSEAINSIQRK